MSPGITDLQCLQSFGKLTQRARGAQPGGRIAATGRLG